MTQTAKKIGNTFTKYSVFIIIAVVLAGTVLFLAGDFVYSQIRPEQPSISYPFPGTTIGTNPPTFQGEMPVAAAIEIYLDGKKLDTRHPQDQTVWSYTPSTQLAVGEHTLSVIAISEQGIRSKPSEDVRFLVSKRPQITSYYDGQIFVDGQPNFEGEAEAATEIDLYIDSSFVATTKSDGAGKWRFTKVPTLAIGKHEAKVIAVKTIGEFGNTSATLAFSIQHALQR